MELKTVPSFSYLIREK